MGCKEGQVAQASSETSEQAEPGVREDEERLRHLVDHAPAMIWITGKDKLCTYTNRSWLEFTGKPASAQLGNGWAESIHPEDVQRCMQTYVESFDRRIEFRMEFRVRRSDGEYRWVFDIGSPRFNAQGVFEGYVGSCADITDRKKIESERIEMREQIAQLNRAASMGQLAASLAHELAQPLAAILTNAQAATRYASMPSPNINEIRAALAEIVEDDHRARTFLQTMRSMFEKQRISRIGLDLNRCVQEISRIIRIDAERKGVKVDVKYAPEAVLVMGDTAAVHQAILNLANNGMDALQHLPRADRRLTVSVKARPLENAGSIFVEDNGTGITEEHRAKLFTPFFTTKRGGLGLGLSICRSLIDSLGGHIVLVDHTGTGAIFRVDLPLIETEGAIESREDSNSQVVIRNR